MSQTETVYFLLRLAGFIAEWLKGDKDPRAWKLSLLIDVGFVVWAMWMLNGALVGFTLMSALIHGRNLVKWKPGEAGPKQTEPFSSSSDSESSSRASLY